MECAIVSAVGTVDPVDGRLGRDALRERQLHDVARLPAARNIEEPVFAGHRLHLAIELEDRALSPGGRKQVQGSWLIALGSGYLKPHIALPRIARLLEERERLFAPAQHGPGILVKGHDHARVALEKAILRRLGQPVGTPHGAALGCLLGYNG